MKLENKDIKQLKKDAWKYTSIYVRSKDADFAGYQECYTCRQMKLWKEMDCGHYMHGKGDLELDNLKPQCVKCNKYLEGNLGLYAERLIEEYGLAWLQQLRYNVEKRGNLYTKEELIEIIIGLKEKINALK